MRQVILSRKQFETIPGHSSKLSVARIKGMVDALLTENGVQNKAWITRKASMSMRWTGLIYAYGTYLTARQIT